MHPLSVREAGVHTARLGLRVPPLAVGELALRFRRRPLPAGGSLLLTSSGRSPLAELPGGWSVVISGLDLVTVEGHPSGSVEHHAGAKALREAADRIVRAARDLLGVEPEQTPEYNRLDTGVLLEASEPTAAAAFLAGMAQATFPRLKPMVVPNESVAGVGVQSGKPLWRCYDCGRKYGTHPLGSRLRLEDVWRPKRHERPTVDAVDAAYLRDRFWRRFSPLSETRPFKGVGADSLLNELAVRVQRRDLDHSAYERMLGYITARAAGIDDRIYSPDARKRRRREARRLALDISRLSGKFEIDIATTLAVTELASAWA